VIKIAYIVRKTSGGMQNHIIGLLSKLDRSQYEPFVISPEAPKLSRFLRKSGIRFMNVDIRDTISAKADLISALQIAKTLQTIKPDLIHVHGNKAAFVYCLAKILYSRTNGKTKSILTVHNYPVSPDNSLKNRSISRPGRRIIFNCYNRIIAVSADIQRSLEKEIGVNSLKVRCIHNGVDMDRWTLKNKSVENDRADLKARHDLPANSFLICTVGRMVPFKALDVLIKSVYHVRRTFSNVCLLIVGDGPLKSQLEKLLKDLNLEKSVKLLGFVDKPDIVLACSDLFVFPSKREPFGIVLLEAAAIGLPIVAIRAGGIPEIIEDGVNGVLAEPGDEFSLAHCIKKTIRDGDLRQRMIVNGRRYVLDKFSLDTMAAGTIETYNDCLYCSLPVRSCCLFEH
jgi:glycosyltransferase involved in cell wall biosynthesis